MFSSNRPLPLVLSLSSIISAANIAVINPCPQDSSKSDLITVTSQYQPVSTCYVQDQDGSPTYSYSTYAYVSTVIPCAGDRGSSSSVLVTDTAQWITVTRDAATTSTVTMLSNKTTPTTIYNTIHRQGLARFNDIGGFAIPGWKGSGLCGDCEWRQSCHMQECQQGSDSQDCWEYDQTWISNPAPPATTTVQQVCATSTIIHQAGWYTFAFPQPQATTVITISASTVTVTIDTDHYSTQLQSSRVVTVIQTPWTAYVTKSAGGPTMWDFTTTITQTSTVTIPYVIQQPSATSQVLSPPITGFPVPSPTTTSSNDGQGSATPMPTYVRTSTYALSTYLTTSGGKVVTATRYTTFTNTLSDKTTLARSSTGMPQSMITGSFVTVTAEFDTPTSGASPSTITLALPSGTTPGTVQVINPSSDNAQPGGLLSTSAFVTLVVLPSGSMTGSSFLTVTLAQPSGTVPGTVEVIDPSFLAATGTQGGLVTSTLPPANTASASGGNGVPAGSSSHFVVGPNLPTSGSAPSTTTVTGTLTTITSDGMTTTTVMVPIPSPKTNVVCNGDVCVSAVVSAPIGQITVTAVVGSDGTTTVASGAASCSGLLCASVGVSATNIGATVTAVVGGGFATNGASDPGTTMATPCTGLLCASIGVSASDIGATVTAVVGDNGSATTTCSGLLCASLGVSASEVGATLTAVVIGSGGTNTASPTGTAICNGVLCASVGVSASDIDATVTAVILDDSRSSTVSTAAAATCEGVLCASLSVSASDVGATLDAVVIPTATGVATTPCSGLLCASVGVSASEIGATLTAIVLPIGTDTATTVCSGSLCASVGVSASDIAGATLTAVLIPTATGAASTTCEGLLCASVGVSASEILGATFTAVVLPTAVGATTTACSGLLCASLGVSASNVGATAIATVRVDDLGTATSTASAATTPCTGALCVSVGASVLDVGATVTAEIGVPAAQSTSTPAVVVIVSNTTPAAGGGSTSTPCSGALCVSVGASVLDVGATVTAVVGGATMSNAAAATTPASSTTGAVATTSVTTPAAAANTLPCSGVLCASVGVSVAGVGATVTAVVATTAVAVSVGAAVATATSPTSAAAATTRCSALVCLSVSASILRRAEASTLIEAAPTTLVTATRSAPNKLASSSSVPKVCFEELNVCAGFDIDRLFTTRRHVPQLRVNRVTMNALNVVLERCLLVNECDTYGVTSDGLLGLTSFFGIDMIKEQLDIYAEAHGNICDPGTNVKLHANNALCLARR